MGILRRPSRSRRNYCNCSYGHRHNSISTYIRRIMNNSNYPKWTLVAILAIAGILAVLFIGQPSTPSAIQTSSAVQVPQSINLAIGAGLLLLLTAAFTWLFEMFNIDLRGFAQPLSLAISAFVVAELQNIVNVIPAQYDVIVQTVFYVLTLILAPLGFFRLIKTFKETPAEGHLL